MLQRALERLRRKEQKSVFDFGVVGAGLDESFQELDQSSRVGELAEAEKLLQDALRLCPLDADCKELRASLVLTYALALKRLDKLDAETAKACGFVAEVFPSRSALMEETMRRVRTMLSAPLAERSLPIFKRMITAPNRELLERVCHSELLELQGRMDSGDSREAIIMLLKQMAAKIVTLQGEEGYWPVSLLEPQKTPETSGTGFFVYGLAWGVNHGLLPRAKYGPAIDKGWKALDAAVEPDGCLGWVQRIGAAPDQVGRHDTQLYGVGAFLLAASEVRKLSRSASSSQGPVKR